MFTREIVSAELSDKYDHLLVLKAINNHSSPVFRSNQGNEFAADMVTSCLKKAPRQNFDFQ